MGISLKDACFIEIDTYFELIDMHKESMEKDKGPKAASQSDIDNFLL